jgi:hypothetical protein
MIYSIKEEIAILQRQIKNTRMKIQVAKKNPEQKWMIEPFKAFIGEWQKDILEYKNSTK